MILQSVNTSHLIKSKQEENFINNIFSNPDETTTEHVCLKKSKIPIIPVQIHKSIFLQQ